jgi:hypothetical protein
MDNAERIAADLAVLDQTIEACQKKQGLMEGQEFMNMQVYVGALLRIREAAANWALIEQMPKGTSLYRTPYTTWCCIASSNGKRGRLGEFFKSPAEAVRDLVEASCGKEPETKG